MGTINIETETSCGTLVVNGCGHILLGHVPDKGHWEIPKGRQEPEETSLETAKRELKEETGLDVSEMVFEEIGNFPYREGKRLHLYKIYLPDAPDQPMCFSCESYFSCDEEGRLVPAMDAYRWASREEIPQLCLPRLANRLLSLQW